MPYTTLISTDDLAQHLDDPTWAIVDCRFNLTDTDAGREAYQESHIPGAVYAHLDEELSGPIIPGETSRHPLPDVENFVAKLSAWGIDSDVQVIVYDDMGGAIAGRLWWMLRWLGHDAVAVLDGGWPVWTAEDRPTTSGIESREAREFVAEPRLQRLANATDVTVSQEKSEFRLLDARAAARYRGETEPLDPVAGHIPGAKSAPWGDNLAEDGTFKSPEELQAKYEALLDGATAAQTIVYCGSGVSANHDIIAMVHAGLGEPRLYAGSWSEWITDSARPVATGDE